MSWSSATPGAATVTFDEYVETHLPELRLGLRDFLSPIVEELTALHQKGQMHGGLFPAALRYDAAGELDRAHLLNQGRAAGGKLPPHVGLGNRAPETNAGQEEGVRTDSYMLGALIFQIITGHPPTPVGRREAHGAALAAASHPDWPGAVITMVNRCLAMDPAARPESAWEIWRELVKPTPSGKSGEAVEVAMPELLVTHLQDAMEEAGAAAARAEESAEGLSEEEPILDAHGDSLTVPAMVLHPPLGLPREQPGILSADGPGDAADTSAATNLFTPPDHPGNFFAMNVQPHERLANGSVGKPYRQSVRELFGEHARRLEAIHVDVPENHGLTFDEATMVLSGVPTEPGELKLPMTVRFLDLPADRLPQEFELWLTINPDPKALWKDLPSDPNGIFAKPDQATDSLTSLELTALAASQRGRAHAHEGKFRDDDFALRRIGATGWHIFFVADGAGSAKYSRRGSQIAAEVTRTKLETALEPGDELDRSIAEISGGDEAAGLEKVRKVVYHVLANAALASLKAILTQVEELKAIDPAASVRDFSTTYIAVLAKRFGPRWFFGSFAIGDGGAGVLRRDGRVELLTHADSGEFAGQTVFLNSPGVFDDSAALLARTKAVFCDDFHFLAVMTDGITDPIFHSDTQLASSDVWEAWRNRLMEKFALDALAPGMEQALLEYLSFFEAGNHDDRTVIIAVPTGHPAHA